MVSAQRGQPDKKTRGMLLMTGNSPSNGSEGGASSSAEAIASSSSSREPDRVVFQLWIVLL